MSTSLYENYGIIFQKAKTPYLGKNKIGYNFFWENWIVKNELWKIDWEKCYSILKCRFSVPISINIEAHILLKC